MSRWKSRSTAWLLAAFAAMAIGGASRLVAQVARPGVTTDLMPALLEEVKALRRDVGAIAGLSVRAQLMVARLQVEEQRLAHLDRRREGVAARRLDAERQRSDVARSVKDLERRLNESIGDERVAVERALTQTKANLQQASAAEGALRAEEAQLTGAIASGQERWAQYNARLDELERALPQR